MWFPSLLGERWIPDVYGSHMDHIWISYGSHMDPIWIPYGSHAIPNKTEAELERSQTKPKWRRNDPERERSRAKTIPKETEVEPK